LFRPRGARITHMIITTRINEVEITDISDFDLERIFECGQCFRWDADKKGVYTGIAKGAVAQLRRSGDSVFISCGEDDFQTVWYDYFDLSRDYATIRRQLCIDEHMQKATEFGAGIRILRQDKWEALCSFIISQCNNIPRIKKIVDALCRLYGDSIQFGQNEYYTFPKAETLARLCTDDLVQIRCGYRAQYIIDAAKAVASGEIDLESLANSTPQVARAKLKSLRGVGDKVADCAMLFGLHMLDSFPRDVWVKRAVAEYYGPGFDSDVFTPYAGIAQQYIFHHARNGGNKM